MLKLASNHQSENNEFTLSLDEIAREGAKRLLVEALDLEVAEYIQKFRMERDENGRALVVRNGKSKTRRVTTGAGTIEVQTPRVNDKRVDQKFSSNILPPYLRRSANVESLLPLLYLKGLSGNAFSDALVQILGEGASGLSASSISALKKSWKAEFEQWKFQQIKDRIAYVWADGVNVKIRLGEDKKQCLLVIIGVTEHGDKKLLAVEPGYRESEESWSLVLRDLKRRGLEAPLLAIGDGALGFWKALSNVYPTTREARCWVHKVANVLDKLPKRLQGKAKERLHAIMYAEDKSDAQAGLAAFKEDFERKYEKAVKCLEKDFDKLIVHFNFPASHWAHIRTTNPIESVFATVKLRTRVTKGAGNADIASTMAFKLLLEAEKKWRKIRSPEEVRNILNGLEYRDGILIVNSDQKVKAANA